MNELNLATQLTPPRIADDSGVGLSVHHLEFVGLGAGAIADWRARRAPLGMTPGQYRQFCSDFFTAASKDRVLDLDVRLKGSSTAVFSGLHKQLPANGVELATAFSAAYKVKPQPAEQDRMDSQREKLWALQPYPRRRPFDSMFKLGAEPFPSDYDVQLSSNDIADDCNFVYLAKPQYSSHSGQFPLVDPKYGFLLGAIVEEVIPAIMAWADQWEIHLNRAVSVKVFGVSGPPNSTVQFGELSSHHRASDWIMRPPQVGD